MAYLSIPNVAIRGIGACVPRDIEEVADIPFYTADEAAKTIATTGVEHKHVASEKITGSDLSLKAAEELLSKLGWERDSISAICYVTQTPDFMEHPTGFVLHEKLGLPEDCMVLDLYHGCPGLVLGLSSIASLMSHGTINRALLFASDTFSRAYSQQDREKRPLFGDCGTVTALEFIGGGMPMLFEIGSRSNDGKALARTLGAYRNPYTPDSFKKEYEIFHGLRPAEEESAMDGMSVFSFGITVPPKSIKRLCSKYNIELSGVDKLVLHQANKFMVTKIAKKLKMKPQKVPMSLKNYGNTTSASIPLTIVSQCSQEYSTKKLKTICCGFGTGLSWATCYFETDSIVCPDVITL